MEVKTYSEETLVYVFPLQDLFERIGGGRAVRAAEEGLHLARWLLEYDRPLTGFQSSLRYDKW